MKALGMVEVKGFLGAISVADAALKAADVTLLKAEIINGGLTTVELIGDVAAVQAAVEVGTEVAKELNCLIAHHVISRVDAQTEVILSDPEPKSAPEPMKQIEVIEEEIETPDLEEHTGTRRKLETQRVVDLRKQAYKMNLSSLKKSEIKFANKEALIQAIMAEIERSEDEWN
ncbi:BMC domain-containing protein [Enterococcus faecalis]|uniref:BMC domain-containing protein n=1 Tax=Enterococcus faecalis TaxID=1351 RepID=UPI00232BEB5F|nr:BMC domain-containing protein [Enterococcus faecalis]MDB1585917.1 BMC domain-containing protein [Enterococcus faecalis]